MTTHTHETAPTQFVDTTGMRFAYRRFGKASTRNGLSGASRCCSLKKARERIAVSK